MLLDDVIHAFGSVSHDTLLSVILSASVHPTLTDLILYAVQHLTLHMGGHHGVRQLRAMYEAGMGQGDPNFALLCCLVNELRVQLVLQSAGLIATPGGPLRNLGWMDDSSWIGTSRHDIQQVASRLPLAGNLTSLFSNATKTIGFGTTMLGKHIVFDRQPIHFRGMPLRMPADGEYIRLLGDMRFHMFFRSRTFANSSPRAAGRRRQFPWAPYLPTIRCTCTTPSPGASRGGGLRCVLLSLMLCGWPICL